jgi:DNA topoisomerase-1
LAEVLKLDPARTKRIVFHEITKNAILKAIENPRTIDLNRVDAQQARRVLDRIVGFELSPVLWKKIKPALSAGRVQSVAVRLIVEREEEIKNFVSESYYRVTGNFVAPNGQQLKAELSHRLNDEDSARSLLQTCSSATFKVSDITVKPLSKSPMPPFTTSTLQQEASRRLGFTVSQTMMIAQRLYEAGHITYMRTDSVNLSNEAIAAISTEIKDQYGDQYLKVRQYHTSSKGAQEAHEAIRPTYVNKQGITEGTAQEKRLYDLIWKRTVASQMSDAEIEKTTVEITPSTTTSADRFTASGEVIKFDGFMRVYIESREDAAESDLTLLPALNIGDALQMQDILATERFTQQPPRYTEAALVRKMEELGIGRPSTYAPTISTIQQREYVEKGNKEGTTRKYNLLKLANGTIKASTKTETTGSDKGKLIPTDIGTVVNQFLTEYFPDILDYNFTARVEERFDEIAEGKLPWVNEMHEFYDMFHPVVERTLNMRLERKVGERLLGNDPKTGQPVTVKIGRFGPLVQIGEGDSENKPQFASLLKGQSVATITLEEALKLFDFPRNIGQYEDADVTVAIGRFGPYIKHKGVFVSVPKDIQPAAVTLDEAIELINEKRAEQSRKIVKTFSEDENLQILNGRYGVYISYNKENYKIPKTVTDPASLSYDETMAIVNSDEAKPKKARRTTTRKK